MNESRYDTSASLDDRNEEEYREAERAWEEWQISEARIKKGKTELSEEERLARAERCRLIAERHHKEKQRRLEMMMRGEEIQDEAAEEIRRQREEERMESERIANEAERRMGMVVWFTVILISAMGFLRVIFK